MSETNETNVETNEAHLVAERERFQVKIYEAKIALHKARLQAEELNIKLIQAGLQNHVLLCW